MNRFLAVALAGILNGCSSTPQGSNTFTEALLGILPDTARLKDPDMIAFSSDLQTFAWVDRLEGRDYAVIGSWRSRPYSLL